LYRYRFVLVAKPSFFEVNLGWNRSPVVRMISK